MACIARDELGSALLEQRHQRRHTGGADLLACPAVDFSGDRRMDFNDLAAKRRKKPSAAKPQPKALNRGFHGFHG